MNDPSLDDEPLIAFLHERDVPCPRCGYNLRNLTQPSCPECNERLKPGVGLVEPKLGWFLAAIAPGIFAGVFALFLLILLIIKPGAPMRFIVTEVFLVCFGLTAVGLIAGHRRFRRQSKRFQGVTAMVFWFVIVIAFVLFVWRFR